MKVLNYDDKLIMMDWGDLNMLKHVFTYYVNNASVDGNLVEAQKMLEIIEGAMK